MHGRSPVPERDMAVPPRNYKNLLGMGFNPHGLPLGQCPCLSRTLDTQGISTRKSRCGLGAGYDCIKKSFSEVAWSWYGLGTGHERVEKYLCWCPCLNQTLLVYSKSFEGMNNEWAWKTVCWCFDEMGDWLFTWKALVPVGYTQKEGLSVWLMCVCVCVCVWVCTKTDWIAI